MDDFNYEVQKALNGVKKWAILSIVINALILAIIMYIKINE